DYNGEVVAAEARWHHHVPDMFTMEVLAARDGLLVAVAYGYRRVVLEIDNQALGTMENEWQLNNSNNGQDLGLTMGYDITWNDDVEYNMDDLLGAEDHHVNTDQNSDDENNPPPSKRSKRFTVQQVQELEAKFQECIHPDPEVRQELGKKIGLEARQVKFWFQNRRSAMRLKASGNENKDMLKENTMLRAENEQLKQLRENATCFRCRNPTGENQQTSEKWRLLVENARLKDELRRAIAYLNSITQEQRPHATTSSEHLASSSMEPVPLTSQAALVSHVERAKAYLNSIPLQEERPHAMSSGHQASAYMDPAVPLTYTCRTNQATLLSRAERAFEEFEMLATKDQPIWLWTIDGEMLSNQHYDLHTFPAGLLGLCPPGFIAEATRETDMIKGSAMDLVSIFTDAAQWSEMFPGIVAHVKSNNVISSRGSSSRDGMIQLVNTHARSRKSLYVMFTFNMIDRRRWVGLIDSVEYLQMDVEFWVQSPRIPTHNVKFLRYSKMMTNRKWAVVDVSVGGNHGVEQESSSTRCRDYWLLPSGCLLEDKSGGFCKVTWVVHGEYLETAVPILFRQFFRTGQAYGACRWLRSLLRKWEYMAVMHSGGVPRSSSSSGAAISALGKRSVLELAQRMTASFYAAVSGPFTMASANVVDQWCASSGTGAEMLQAAVRMVTWNCAEIMPGEPAITVMSATSTVWLPGTPPLRVFEYLCNLPRRSEWDIFANGGEVQELGYVATSERLHGNAVSVLRPTDIADGTNNNMTILQQTSTDASGSLVVYSLIEENVMRGIMLGADNTTTFLLPSGFAILPDGHGKAPYTAASSSSSVPIGHNNGAGTLLTVAFQSMIMPTSCPSGNLAPVVFDNSGQQLCYAINKIKDAIRANTIVPV
ncbi:Homeobox-leucine zipper protein ROC6, partial [Dichanthelium oligosanthes]